MIASIVVFVNKTLMLDNLKLGKNRDNDVLRSKLHR